MTIPPPLLKATQPHTKKWGFTSLLMLGVGALALGATTNPNGTRNLVNHGLQSLEPYATPAFKMASQTVDRYAPQPIKEWGTWGANAAINTSTSAYNTAVESATPFLEYVGKIAEDATNTAKPYIAPVWETAEKLANDALETTTTYGSSALETATNLASDAGATLKPYADSVLDWMNSAASTTATQEASKQEAKAAEHIATPVKTARPKPTCSAIRPLKESLPPLPKVIYADPPPVTWSEQIGNTLSNTWEAVKGHGAGWLDTGKSVGSGAIDFTYHATGSLAESTKNAADTIIGATSHAAGSLTGSTKNVLASGVEGTGTALGYVKSGLGRIWDCFYPHDLSIPSKLPQLEKEIEAAGGYDWAPKKLQNAYNKAYWEESLIGSLYKTTSDVVGTAAAIVKVPFQKILIPLVLIPLVEMIEPVSINKITRDLERLPIKDIPERYQPQAQEALTMVEAALKSIMQAEITSAEALSSKPKQFLQNTLIAQQTQNVDSAKNAIQKFLKHSSTPMVPLVDRHVNERLYYIGTQLEQLHQKALAQLESITAKTTPEKAAPSASAGLKDSEKTASPPQMPLIASTVALGIGLATLMTKLTQRLGIAPLRR